ncbi:MAG: LamG domain-containing protein, partial [Motiliproteus sp.]|nr:LamG domain-containing protein [Motiliproteus sp.]
MAIPADAVYCGQIDIQSTQVAGTADKIDFVVQLTEDNFWSELMDNGFHSAQNGGGGLRFSSDPAGVNQLAHEASEFVVSATPANQRARVFVKVSTVAYNSNTPIHVWSSPTASDEAVTSTYGRNAVWSASQRAFHISEGSGGVIVDSSGNGADGVISGAAWVDGQDGKALDFDGYNDYVFIGAPEITGAFTVELYINATTDTKVTSSLLGAPDSPGNTILNFESYNNSGLVGYTVRSAADYKFSLASPNNTPTRLTYVNDGVSMHIFKDGVLIDSMTPLIDIQFDTLAAWAGGTRGNLDGVIESVYVYPTNRSVDWISTRQNNLASPSTFAIPGTFEPAQGGGTTPVTKDMTILWNALNAVQSNRTLLWNVLNPVSKDLTF